VTTFYWFSTFGGEWRAFESDTLTSGCWLSNEYPQSSNPAMHYTPWRIIEIHQNTEQSLYMVNSREIHGKYLIWTNKLFNKNRLEPHYQQYHQISKDEGLLPNGILSPASWVHPEASWFNCSRCTWMAITMLPINDLLTDKVLGAPPPEHTANEEPIDCPQSDLTCTSDPTNAKAHRLLVAVQNVGGIV